MTAQQTPLPTYDAGGHAIRQFAAAMTNVGTLRTALYEAHLANDHARVEWLYRIVLDATNAAGVAVVDQDTA